jgi:hypothetical protein
LYGTLARRYALTLRDALALRDGTALRGRVTLRRMTLRRMTLREHLAGPGAVRLTRRDDLPGYRGSTRRADLALRGHIGLGGALTGVVRLAGLVHRRARLGGPRLRSRAVAVRRPGTHGSVHQRARLGTGGRMLRRLRILALGAA